ncbi:NAD(P)-dependent oxidoreductase [Christiangramia salexigens]|uniref:Dihydrofolate reductase n=1 Tax=Christiangramia salexigens TaxID=1913577 RepID=A0A1L3J3X2_9FLAO|nr:NAD(P)-dependent oxidoreductase [Christiangramia salexigens]APG59802.1 dihydrofolate reductase [Christiangramia salexigens]
MKKFNQIVCVDNTKLNDEAIQGLKELSENEVEVYTDTPESNQQIIERIGEAQAIIVSWRTEIDAEVIDACSNLEYIGMACSLFDDESANVDVKHARNKGITVTGIKDYGDPGVTEFIISELIQLLNGYKSHQWKEMPVELGSSKVGIIGFGVTGQLLAKALLALGAEVSYYSRTRKPEWEQKGIEYKSLKDLLRSSDIISFHVPRNVKLLEEKEFGVLGNSKIIINTSLGLPFSEKAFYNWMKNEANYAILDGDGRKSLDSESLELERLISYDAGAGWSEQTLVRLSQKVLQNIENYCEKKNS